MAEAADKEATDLEDWARRYLDLWEDQVTALAADCDFSKLLLAQVSAFNAFPGFLGAEKAAASQDPAVLAAALSSWQAALATAMASAVGASTGPQANRDRDEGVEQDGGRRGGAEGGAGAEERPTGSAAAAVSSRSQQPDLDILARRLADLEARVAGLEADAGGDATGGTAPGGGRRRQRSTS